MDGQCAQDLNRAPRSPLHNGPLDIIDQLYCLDDEIDAGSPMNLVEDESAPRRTICFGTIADVRVNWLEGFELDRSFFDGRTSDGDGPFKVLSRQHYYHLQSETGIDFAVLNARTARALRSIFDLPSIEFEAFLMNNGLDASNRIWGGKTNSVPACINISGSPRILADVGSALAKVGVYLQRPDNINIGIEYRNPQSLDIPDWVDTDIVPEEPRPQISAVESTYQDVGTVLDSLDQSDTLEEIDIDKRILTGLLPHQKRAVDFMIRKESGFTSEKFSLWKLHQLEDQKLYRNVVNGSKRSLRPIDPRGGILADDMGLGKTLAVLSQILATQTAAQDFMANPAATEPNTIQTIANRSLTPLKATLVVVPLSLLNYWVEEIEKHVSQKTLSIHKYHGPNRETEARNLSKYDLVLTTYHTLAMEFIRSESLLQRINWFRIVLDEAHIIRHYHTKQFKAAALLSGLNRWCLTGTPIQNKLEDIGSLLRFLKIHPLDSTISFRNFIIEPLRGGNAKGLHNIRTVLDTLCLRRTRDILPLPEFIEEVIRLDLSKPEDELYSCLRYEARRILDDAINKSSTRGVFHGILQSILRLRILCNHGTLHQIVSPDTSPDRFSEHNETFSLLNQIGRAACASCDNPVDSLQEDEGSITGILKACSHIICQDCDEKLLKKLGSRKRNRDSEMCSLCAESSASESGPSTLEISIPSDAYLTPPRSVDGRTTPLGFSTKISALVETLRRTGLSGKSIVFSFWRKTLDLIEVELNANRLPSVRMDGTVSIRDRQRVISEFENTPVPILLMTTGTGSQGLSLPAANHVFVVEPQWNPAVENQAIGRVLRLGQTRRVTVTRYIMRNTIEEAVRDRQSKKLEIAELTWKKENPEEQTLKTLMDLRALF